MDQPFRSQQPTDNRLDSWKEIAAFFGRDERTVKRWEKERGLPVRRLPGKGKGGVFAYARELGDWLGARGSAEDVSYSAPARTRGVLVELPSSSAPHIATDADGPHTTLHGYNRAQIVGLVAFAVVIALIAAGVWRQRLVAGRALHNAGASTWTLTPQPLGKSAHAANPEAEDLYLKGRYYWNKRTGESLKQAVDYFTQSIVHDPNFAPAYAGLADSYNLLREFSDMPDSEAFPRGIAAAKKAVELDDTLSEAHRTLAFDYFWGSWDFPAAAREFKRAIELNPNDVEAYHWRATSFILLMQNEQAVADIERARQMDPSSVSIVADRAYVLFLSGRHDEATSSLLQLEKTDPAFLSSYNYLGIIYFQNGDWPKWLEQVTKAAELTNNRRDIEFDLAAEKVLRSAGARKMLETIAQKWEDRFEKDPNSPIPNASLFAMIGDKQKALHYLQIGYEKHRLEFLFMRIDPAFVILHDEPAYRELLARAGLPPVN